MRQWAVISNPKSRMNRIFASFLAVVVMAKPAVAVEFSEAQIAGKRVTVCRVNVRKEGLQLFLRDESKQPFKRFERLSTWLETRGKILAFAMNAGMYHGDFSPVGLFVADGTQLFPLNTAIGEGNFFSQTKRRFSRHREGSKIVESSEYPNLREHVLLATQSGPLLVRAGKIHPVFKQNSKSRLYRNGVGVPSPDTALFAISDAPVNFHEFTTFFRDTLRCPDALFLDGTISSLHSTKLNRSDFKMDLEPIIGITEPK